MQFLIETQRSDATPDRGRLVALRTTLADVREVAAQLVGQDVPA
jgi:hypothetical protein